MPTVAAAAVLIKFRRVVICFLHSLCVVVRSRKTVEALRWMTRAAAPSQARRRLSPCAREPFSDCQKDSARGVSGQAGHQRLRSLRARSLSRCRRVWDRRTAVTPKPDLAQAATNYSRQWFSILVVEQSKKFEQLDRVVKSINISLVVYPYEDPSAFPSSKHTLRFGPMRAISHIVRLVGPFFHGRVNRTAVSSSISVRCSLRITRRAGAVTIIAIALQVKGDLDRFIR
jgi:hypothetical protein